MNYLVYLGLKRYGYHAEAAELARKNLAIAQSTSASLENGGGYGDQFSIVDGKPVVAKSGAEGDGQRTYFFGLAIWPAVEEVFSADPWTGLSFGSVAATEESRLERIDVSGAKFNVTAGPERTVIRRNGVVEVECETPVRLRAYQSNDSAISFVIEVKDRAPVLIPPAKGRKITVSVDDKVLGSVPAGAAATFKIPAGTHKALIIK